MIELSVSLASNGVVKVPGYEQLVRFGYTKNRGVYRLAVSATGEWEGLTIRAFWHVPNGKDPTSSLVVDGYVAVPASVTAQPGSGCVTFEGSDGTRTVTSADLRYRVAANSGTDDGSLPEPGTPAWQQLVDAVHTDATAAEQAKTDAQTAAKQAGASVKKAGQALSDTITAKEDALKAIGDKQTTATQAVDTARDKALQQVEASTKAAQTAASEAATSAGNADQSAQKAADSLRELKDGIANGNFKGEPGNDGKSPVVTVTDIENGHRVSITDKDGTKTIDVLNGKDGKDAPQIDDATVTDSAPWSSKHIVDMLCPPISETGNPMVCYPVADYPLGVTASWEPTQEGSGTPSPENIRPIKGRDSVTVERCGENLLDMSRVAESKDCTVDDSTIHVVDTSGWGASYILLARKYPAGTYTIQIDADTAAHGCFLLRGYDASGNMVDVSILPRMEGYDTIHNTYYKATLLYPYNPSGTHKVITFTVQGAAYFQVGLTGGLSAKETSADLKNFALVPGSTPPTEYTPYRGDTLDLALPSTIYGGTVDAVTGEGQESIKLVILDGDELKFTPGKGNVNFWNISQHSVPDIDKIIVTSHFPKSVFSINQNYDFIFTTLSQMHSFFASADELNAYLAAQYAAGTPVQIAYKLRTSNQIFTATGAQPIPALSGVNTVITDADTLTVTGRADPIKRITDLEDAVASMTNT